MDEETAERIFYQKTLTRFYKTEIRPCKAMCQRTQQLPTATTQQHATTCNSVQMDEKCNIQQCCVRLHAAFVRTSTYSAQKD